MSLYMPTIETPGSWPAKIEGVLGGLGAGTGQILSKVKHLSLAEELFIAAVATTEREHRPWGIISWVAEAFGISRPTVYALGERVQAMLSIPKLAEPQGVSLEAGQRQDDRSLERLVLTCAFPGSVSLRSIQEIVSEALSKAPSLGGLSEFLLATGQQAGETLDQIDYSPLGPVMVVRDETYWQDWPILLVIEPVTTTILFGVVSPDCQAETWGAALLIAQDRGAPFAGLIEDMARMYPQSQELAEMTALDVQKDTWHVQHTGKLIRCDLQRSALAAITRVDAIEKKLLHCWDDDVFYNQYIPAVERMECLLEQHDTFEVWLGHLGDALELVDWRSGEIRDSSTNGWLLDATLAAMSGIDHPRVQSFVKTLRRYRDNLLTFLDRVAASLTAFQSQLDQVIDDPDERNLFIRTVARCWRLRQALINGQTSFRALARAQEDLLLALTHSCPNLALLASQLMFILDAAGHTSSLIECVNSLLKSFLSNRQAFRNIDTAQAYLNLFILWHNMRVYQRGKRKGKSPFQWAGIDPGTDDWRDLLGFAAN